MKTNCKTGFLRHLAIATTLALGAGVAFPGTQSNSGGAVAVTLNADGSGTATGVLSLIHNSTTTREYIGCDLRVGATTYVFCHALTEQSVHGSCYTSSAFLAETMHLIDSDVRLTYTWNSRGTCTSITVQHASQFAPKKLPL